jgi:hypothetical protein
MFEKYIPFVVSTKYSGEVNASPSAINFNNISNKLINKQF